MILYSAVQSKFCLLASKLEVVPMIVNPAARCGRHCLFAILSFLVRRSCSLVTVSILLDLISCR